MPESKPTLRQMIQRSIAIFLVVFAAVFIGLRAAVLFQGPHAGGRGGGKASAIPLHLDREATVGGQKVKCFSGQSDDAPPQFADTWLEGLAKGGKATRGVTRRDFKSGASAFSYQEDGGEFVSVLAFPRKGGGSRFVVTQGRPPAETSSAADAPGTDSSIAPRPPVSTRLYAMNLGETYFLGLYETGVSTDEIERFYDGKLTEAGWKADKLTAGAVAKTTGDRTFCYQGAGGRIIVTVEESLQRGQARVTVILTGKGKRL